MNKKFNYTALIIVSVGLATISSAHGDNNSYKGKKISAKVAGATMVGGAGYGVMYHLLPFLFSDMPAHTKAGYYFVNGAKLLCIAASSYYGAQYFWHLLPEGKIERSKNAIENYDGLLMACQQAENIYEYLDTRYVGNDIPLLQAFNAINAMRNELQSCEKGLKSLKNSSIATVEDVVGLQTKVRELLDIAEAVLVRITRHPNWAHYIALSEMRLARTQPRTEFTYKIK